MIESMTGFGSAAARIAGSKVEVSLRSVNSRSFKLSVRMPDALGRVLPQLEEVIRSRIARGTVYCQVELNGPAAIPYTIDEETLLGYCRALRAVAKKTGLPQGVGIGQLAVLPGAIRYGAIPGRAQGCATVLKAARKAVGSLLVSRRAEGAKIEGQIRKFVQAIAVICNNVAGSRRKLLRDRRKKLTGRIRELLADSGVEVDKKDILRETALLTERSDIAEELQRLSMHTGLMEKALSISKPAGRRLEFIAQEMLREASTMSAKSASSKLVAPLLELKTNIDRIREQAQNVQ